MASHRYVQGQQPIIYLPKNEIFCVTAFYNQTSPTSVDVHNYANSNGVNGARAPCCTPTPTPAAAESRDARAVASADTCPRARTGKVSDSGGTLQAIIKEPSVRATHHSFAPTFVFYSQPPRAPSRPSIVPSGTLTIVAR